MLSCSVWSKGEGGLRWRVSLINYGWFVCYEQTETLAKGLEIERYGRRGGGGVLLSKYTVYPYLNVHSHVHDTYDLSFLNDGSRMMFLCYLSPIMIMGCIIAISFIHVSCQQDIHLPSYCNLVLLQYCI